MRGAPIINTFLRYTCTLWGLLDRNNEGNDIFSRVFIITLVDLGVADDPKKFVYKVYRLFLLFSFDCQYQSWIILAKVFEKILLESHLYSPFRYPKIFIN